MPSISNLTTALTLYAGQVIAYSGLGVATVAGAPQPLSGIGAIGPFDRDVTVSLTGSVTYNVSTVGGVSRVLARAVGSIASPIATVAGNGTLALIPLFPGSIADISTLRVQAIVKRTGATATASCDAYLGTVGSTSDSTVGSLTINATTGHAVRTDMEAQFGESRNSFLSSGGVGLMNSAGGAGMVDRSTNVDRDALMFLTLAMTSANAGDSFALLGYVVTNET